MKESIYTVLREKIRPLLTKHGGDVELVDLDQETGTVTVKLLGMCADCPSSPLTLRAGVERILQENIPGIKQVISA